MRSALANVSEITNLQTSPASSGGTATFEVPEGFDYQAALDALVAGGNEHLEGWKVRGG